MGENIPEVYKLLTSEPEKALTILKEQQFDGVLMKTFLFVLYEHCNEELFLKIIKDFPKSVGWKNCSFETPLFVLLRRGCDFILNTLSLFDISSKTLNGDTVVHYICRSKIANKKLLLEQLLTQKPEFLNEENIFGETPLHLLSKNGNIDEIEFLVSLGANISLMSKSGMTPLMYAIDGHNDAIINYFINHQNDKDEQTDLDDKIDSEEFSFDSDDDSLSSEDGDKSLSLVSTLSNNKSKPSKSKRNEKKSTKQRTEINAIKQEVGFMTINKRNPLMLNESVKHIDKKKKYKVLSIDGGGMKGILEAIILGRILKKHPKFFKNVNLICGCSVGSILAGFLACGYEPSVCADLIEYISNQIFVNPNLAVGEAKYNTNKLQIILEQVFKETTIKDVPIHFLVDSFLIDPETNPRECKAHVFTNLKKGYEQEKLSDICLRSAAAPTYFRPYQNYVDGGILNNTPIGVGWSLLFGEQGLQLDPKNVVCFSLSAGKPDPFFIDRNKIGKGGMLQWATQISDTFMYATRSWSIAEGEIFLGDRFLRFDPPLGCVIKLDQIELIPKLKQIAEDVDLTIVDKWLEKYWND